MVVTVEYVEIVSMAELKEQIANMNESEFDDYHKHQCPLCSRVWKHDPIVIVNNEAAHTCPFGCGAEAYWIYTGAVEPEAEFHGQKSGYVRLSGAPDKI